MEENEREKEKPTAARGGSATASLLFLLTLFLLFFGLGAAMEKVSPVHPQKDEALEARLERAEKKIEALERRFHEPLAEPSAPNLPNAAADAMNLEGVSQNLSNIAGVLASLQEQIRASSETTNKVRETTKAGLAITLAFVQMQAEALAGRPFEKERQVLRGLIGDDQTMIDLLLKLEPSALQGAAPIATLREEWAATGEQAQAALRKSAAKTWQDRVIVALESLVSVRSLSPSSGGTFSLAGVDLDLARGDLAAALDKTSSFPDEAGQVVEPWRARAKARLEMERGIAALADHLIGQGEEENPPPAAEPDKEIP